MKKISLLIILILLIIGYFWLYYDWFCISDSETCNGEMDIDWSDNGSNIKNLNVNAVEYVGPTNTQNRVYINKTLK